MTHLRSAIVLALAVGIAAATFSLGATQADASVGAWSQAVKISGNLKETWFPTISADDSGKVHVVFNGSYADTPRLDIAALFYAHTNGGQSWSTPNDLAVIYSGHALRSSIATDSAGRTHVIYKGWGSLDPDPTFDPPRNLGAEDLWYMSIGTGQPDSVSSWSSRQRVTHNPQGYYSDIGIDSRGVLHAIWTESDSLGWGLYYAHSTDGGQTWSDRVGLNETGSVWWYRAHLIIDSRDGLHVVWEETTTEFLGRTRAAFYAQSTDGGKNWTRNLLGGTPPQARKPGDSSPTPQATTANAPPAGPQQPAVAVDGQRQIVLVYRENETNLIFYRVSTDGTRWSPPQRLPGVRQGVYRPYDIYDMVTDSAGHVHLAFVGYPDGADTVSLLHSEWDGRAWSPPHSVLSPANPEYPKLAISGGNRLHLVWFVGDHDSIDRVPIGIYYSTAEVAAPRVFSGGLPVPEPAVKATPAAIGLPLPPVTLNEPRQQLQRTPAENQPPAPMWESILHASSFPLFAAVLPVGLLIAVVIVHTLGLGGFGRRE